MDDLIAGIHRAVSGGVGYLWLILLAIWGGTANYLSRVQRGQVEAFSFVELVGEWAVSGFAGVLTALICQEMALSWHMTAFFTGVAGHLGGRALYMAEMYAKRRVGILTGHRQDLPPRSRKEEE
jgi:hypothetical protein